MTERTGSESELVAPDAALPVRRALAQAATRIRTPDALGVLVMWICIAAARVLPSFVENAAIADPIVAIVSMPLIIVVPRQLGVLLRPLVAGRWRLAPVEEYVVAWLAGLALLIVGLRLVTGIAGVPSNVAAAFVLIIATASLLLAGRRSVTEGEQRFDVRAVVREAWLVVATLAMVAAPVTLIRLVQPYPLQVGWGLFSYNFRVLQFIESDHITIAPGLHTPIHASLLGVTSLATGVEPQGLIWAAPLVLYASFALGVYALARRLLDSDLLALGAVWVAVWVLSITTFQHLHGVGMRGVLLAMWPWILLVMHTLLPSFQGKLRDQATFFAPALVAIGSIMVIRWFLPSVLQVWALLLLVATLVAALRLLPDRDRVAASILMFLGGSLAFVHIIEGPIFFAFGVGFVALLAWKPVAVRWRLVLGGVSAAAAGFILLQVSGALTFDDPSVLSRLLLGDSRADAILLSFDAKYILFKDGMTYPILALLALSAVRLVIWPHSVHAASIAAIGAATFLYFLPESGLHRVLGPVIPLIGVSIVLEAHWFAQRALSIRWRPVPTLLAGALVIAALIALTPTLTSSLRSQIGLESTLGLPRPLASGEFSNLTQGEYEASVWIEEHTPQDWMIVSDPTTMFFMQGLTFHPQVANTRAWVAESEYTRDDVRRLRFVQVRILEADTPSRAADAFARITEGSDGALLVISSRTLGWLAAPGTLFQLGKPSEFLMEPEAIRSFCGYREMAHCPAWFLEAEEFSVIYNRDDVAVLALTERLDELELE